MEDRIKSVLFKSKKPRKSNDIIIRELYEKKIYQALLLNDLQMR